MSLSVDPDRGQYVLVQTTKGTQNAAEQCCAVLDAKSRRAFFITITTDLAKASAVDAQGKKRWLPLHIKDQMNQNEKKIVLLKMDQCWEQLIGKKTVNLERTVNFFADTPSLYHMTQRRLDLAQLRIFPAPSPVKETLKSAPPRQAAPSKVPPLPPIVPPVVQSHFRAPDPEKIEQLQALGNLSSRSSARKVLTYIAKNKKRITSHLSRQNSSAVIPPEDSGLSRPILAHVRPDSRNSAVRRPRFYLQTQTDPIVGGFKQVEDVIDVTKMRLLTSLKPKTQNRVALRMQQQELRILDLLRGKRGIAQLKDSISHHESVEPFRQGKVKWLELILIKYEHGDLCSYLEANDVSLKTRLRLACDIACGVTALHAEGIVHRDLKPDNVLVGEDRSSVLCAITDFGLAKEGNKNLLVRITDCCGTKTFIAPEVQKLEKILGVVDGKAADIWSLGQVLDYLFTEGKDGTTLNKDPAIAELITKMSRTKPSKRPTAEQVLESLVLFIAE